MTAFADLTAHGTIAAYGPRRVPGNVLGERFGYPMQVTTAISSMEPLVAQFMEAARSAAATVEVVPRSSARLSDAILRATLDADHILFAPPRNLPQELFAEFLADSRVAIEPTPDEMVHAAAGVTEAFAGVALTGSVCVDVSYQRTAMVSLLAPLHIAVVSAETIVPRPRDLFSPDGLQGKNLARDFVLLTGPSATADMGPLVRGVHGPHRLHIIVVR